MVVALLKVDIQIHKGPAVLATGPFSLKVFFPLRYQSPPDLPSLETLREQAPLKGRATRGGIECGEPP